MCTVFAIDGKRIPDDEILRHLEKTHSRGPDDQRIARIGGSTLAFQRLAIMDLTDTGMQPFVLGDDAIVCNGEIYGWREIRKDLESKGYVFVSESDCEILLPMWREYGTEMFGRLGSEFAMVIQDHISGGMIAARDPLGIRPLYYGQDRFGEMCFASEPRDLTGLCGRIMPFPPGHYWRDGKFTRYIDLTDPEDYIEGDLDQICSGIRERLIRSVEERLDADAPLGFLLSGGLDSSLVCAISSKILGRKIRTFAIGMDTDPIDLKYAKQAADYIGADHTEFHMTRDDVISVLPEVIRILGTWDITTIRASVGMYLCCRKIRETTDIRVMMTGEISDELFGYKYTDFAPDAASFQAEAKKRIDEIHMYDVLRADRCITSNSMEGRVPFGSSDFVKYVMAIDPEIKMNRYGMGKYLLRKAFEKDDLLPEGILWRDKAAFSDAVGHSMVDDIREYAESKYSDEEFAEKSSRYEYVRPFTKESLLYREIFESYYPGNAEMIKDFWMPNRSWEGCDVDDPSARVLSNYGDSGR